MRGNRMFKRVQPSKQLQAFQSLQGRTEFTQDQMIIYNNLYKGFLGEKKFSNILDKQLTSDCIILFDLLLEAKNNLFQLDCLLIFENDIFLLEIKNFLGDFYIQNEKWYVCSTEKEIKNPLIQLNRSAYLYRELLSEYKLRHPVKSYVIFVNQEFTLYQTPRNIPIILPTQINRFIQQLNQTPSKLSSRHYQLGEQLIAAHMTSSPYEKLPEYQFTTLRKGVFCQFCRRKMHDFRLGKMLCHHCGYLESIDSAVMRSVSEFNILFPERQITSSIIHEWSGLNRTKKTIRRILKKYLIYVPNYRHSYFAFENNNE